MNKNNHKLDQERLVFGSEIDNKYENVSTNLTNKSMKESDKEEIEQEDIEEALSNDDCSKDDD